MGAANRKNLLMKPTGALEPHEELFCADRDESVGSINSIDENFLAGASMEMI
jgi:hypothetical protein